MIKYCPLSLLPFLEGAVLARPLVMTAMYYLELDAASLREFHYAEMAWIRTAMEDLDLLVANTSGMRMTVQHYEQNRGHIINVRLHATRERAHRLILSTLLAAHQELTWVGERIMGNAQDTLEQAVAYELPSMSSRTRKQQLELAIRLVQTRCLCLEDFNLWLMTRLTKIVQYYDVLQWRAPIPGSTTAPSGEWKDDLVKYRRYLEYHEPVSIECTPPLRAYEPLAVEALEDTRVDQRADALSRLDGTEYTLGRLRESTQGTTPSEQRERDPSTARNAQWRLPAPAVAAPADTRTWHIRPRPVAADPPLRVDSDGSFNAWHRDKPTDRRVRTEAARRGPMPMPDLAEEACIIHVPKPSERNRLDYDFEHYDPERWHRGPHLPSSGRSATPTPVQQPVPNYQQAIDAQWQRTISENAPTRSTWDRRARDPQQLRAGPDGFLAAQGVGAGALREPTPRGRVTLDT